MSITEKAVVAVSTRTPAPVYVAIAIVLIALILVVGSINTMGCADFRSAPSWLNLVSLKEVCTLGGKEIELWKISAGAILISFLASAAVIFFPFRMFEAGKDDALSGVRKKLIGEWKMSATSEDGTAWEGDGTFEIEPEYRKLHLLIDLPARPPMAKKIMDIYDISINPRENPISISYFVDD